MDINLDKIFVPKIPLSEQILMVKHLSMMLRSGISELESIQILRDQTKNKNLQKILRKVATNVENGQALSDSLKPFINIFGELFINVISLGELSGTLPENLDYLADEVRKKTELKSKVKAALIYPAVILLATIGVVGALIVFVLPKILPVFASFGTELPLSTKILIGISDFLQNNFILVAIGLVIVAFGFKIMLRFTLPKYIWSRILLALPISGTISIQYNIANITRTLGILLKSGVKIVEAVGSTSSGITNPVYRKALNEAVEGVKRGESIYKYLETRPDIFPTTLTRMIQIGERTGNLDTNLKYLSEFYESELNEKIRNLSSVLEPILMLIMGLLVGFVAISIITPIYGITQNIGR